MNIELNKFFIPEITEMIMSYIDTRMVVYFDMRIYTRYDDFVFCQYYYDSDMRYASLSYSL